ncbi:hypothetical protein PHYBLDRAFT_167988 [Phycomyces blakesleeanus NRRL 1555(-)]|uniref:Uncharacterized protein n=1 Tax=Phycomyces blakesleeanus (strain ATCC 8743b / DSM 1359 / FGSC 10004 / NBRC 33097 / NRRL 1555) TaxID=763407 RepID=A0A167MZD8_PHYB8|nr:hypothetical protein PHYBLDRAFT_167988 [Phycomyces blakesleeanus NRRL 1555(-)]OAD74584.1 hypothetical protein PHYBLDRAFT_167988 [Phycomyces blakesleeanus NRRL 1555(-)]|eukprot:XP_018292624.1 hypothetical protein PHYBLDRAFT_167988 [Phycomyces blakesleeanus NRRL 1555(-)]
MSMVLTIHPGIVQQYKCDIAGLCTCNQISFGISGNRQNPTVKCGIFTIVCLNFPSIKYPIKGLFAESCTRHESVIKLVDMETGEGFKYPLSIINQLLGDSGSDSQSADNSPNINVIYDVVCKLAKSLKKRSKYSTYRSQTTSD